MRIREAKDFLVAQTAEQAALEGVPLKRFFASWDERGRRRPE
jgi:hypothetical protein